MLFFLDTAILDEIRPLAELGLVDGITTNPTLIAKSGRRQEDVIAEICKVVDGPISAEVIAVERKGMVDEGLRLADIHPNVVVKIPLTKEGLAATKSLSDRDIRVNVTLCFQPLQALLAAKAGAAFISPFLGRLDDIGQDGTDLIREIRMIYDNYDFDTQILAASLRHPLHVLQVALEGADCATLPPKVFEQLWSHPLTDSGLAKFLADHAAAQGGKA